jgi:hypothetical protein
VFIDLFSKYSFIPVYFLIAKTMKLPPCASQFSRPDAAFRRTNSRFATWIRYGHTGLAALVLAGRALAGIPAGTVLEVRLLTSMSSYGSKPGTEVQAFVVAPGCPDGLPAGTIIRGNVKHVSKVGLGLIHESASLDLEFSDLSLPDGQTFPLRARLIGVDNAREHVNRRGSIRGIRATASLSNRMASKILFAVDDHPLFLLPMLAVETVLFRFPDPEMDYAPGTEMHLELEDPINTGTSRACAAANESARADESPELQDLIAGLPSWTYSKRKHEPEDPTNLVFVGSQDELDRAFAAGGWTGAQNISRATGLRAVRAVAERRGYSDAPMRSLLLDGVEPDINRQKTLNTFTKRHHLRMWKRPEQWHGRPIWASAATRDIAIIFSLRQFEFTHQIQSDVDAERDKVVSDLVFTGCADSVTYVRRPDLAPASGREGRRGVTTDARVAVVELNSCQEPREGRGMATENPEPPLAFRLIRRVTLTLRSHLIRDNIFWKYGEGAWMTYRAVRSCIQGRLTERHIERLARARATSDAQPIEPGSAFVEN